MTAKMTAERQAVRQTVQQKIHDEYFKLCEHFVEFTLLYRTAHPTSQQLFLKEFEKAKAGEQDCFSILEGKTM